MNTIDLLLDRLRYARQWTLSLLADIDERDWFNPPRPGLGHVAWQVGHIASSEIVLVHMRCFDRPYADCAPDRYQSLFGRGSKPVSDRTAYPPVAEIRAFFDRVQQEALALVAALPESRLPEPTHGDPHPMFTHKGGAIGMAAMHEAFHAGQIALTRRLAGKAPLR
jgi:uncharacterized damage-inducible protein DinB